MFAILLHKDAAKFLESLDNETRERIKKKLKTLESDPFPMGAVKLVGTKNIFRIRIGDYRTLYYIDYQKSTIIIDKIDKRSRAYR